MIFALPVENLDPYKSASQRARVATEVWGLGNLYCPNCKSNDLNRTPHNTPVVDFICPICESGFQMKSQSRAVGCRLVDAGYDAMKKAIVTKRTPNLFVLQYDREMWLVQNLLLIPSFAFSLSAVECRKPLGPKARRAGWVGCNIRLDLIPGDAKIPIVADGIEVNAAVVRQSYARLRPLDRFTVEKRGWTLDVLKIIRKIAKAEFSLAEVYAFESSLAQLHPKNYHLRDKIRQQLRVLRDIGLLEFLGAGRYRMKGI
jgi:type II restriction enzyme